MSCQKEIKGVGENTVPSKPPYKPQSYSVPFGFNTVCEQYEDDPYSSFAFGGDHRSDVDFGLATPIHMNGWPNQTNSSNERQQGPQRCKKSSGEGL